MVINCGAYTAVDLAESEPDLARHINADGPTALAIACAAAGTPLVHLSTDYVFDGTKTSPYLESDPTNPQSVYGATKLEGELGVAASGARHAIVRVSWVHAPEGKNFVRTMLRLAASRERWGWCRPDRSTYLRTAPRHRSARHCGKAGVGFIRANWRVSPLRLR